jgi:hypothetical protein
MSDALSIDGQGSGVRVTIPGSPKAPPGLQARGRRMWRESLEASSFAPGHLVLLEEACRVADRLEVLDRLIRRPPGRSGAGSDDSGDDPPESVDIAALLAEARQQQNALKGILAELRQGQRGGGPTKVEGGAGVSDLSARIAERRRQAEG